MKIIKKEWIEKVPHSEEKPDKICCKKMKEVLENKRLGIYPYDIIYSKFIIKNGRIGIITYDTYDDDTIYAYFSYCPFCGEEIE